MKLSVILTDGTKQIMMTPENDYEKTVLKMIDTDDQIETVITKGTFTDMQCLGAEIYKCKGGYLRAEENNDSLMFVIKKKGLNESM